LCVNLIKFKAGKYAHEMPVSSPITLVKLYILERFSENQYIYAPMCYSAALEYYIPVKQSNS
jgi:hypothetical protein